MTISVFDHDTIGSDDLIGSYDLVTHAQHAAHTRTHTAHSTHLHTHRAHTHTHTHTIYNTHAGTRECSRGRPQELGEERLGSL